MSEYDTCPGANSSCENVKNVEPLVKVAFNVFTLKECMTHAKNQCRCHFDVELQMIFLFYK